MDQGRTPDYVPRRPARAAWKPPYRLNTEMASFAAPLPPAVESAIRAELNRAVRADW